MLDIKVIRENPERVEEVSKNKKDPADISGIVAMDDKRRSLIYKVETLKKEKNAAGKEIGGRKKRGEDASEIIEKMQSVSSEIKRYEEELKALTDDLNEEMSKVPNIVHESVPHGDSEEDNVVVYEWDEGVKTEVKEPLNHLEISDKYDLFDFPRGSKVSGTGFPVYKNMGARLDRALVNFMLDTHASNGYAEIAPPYLVNAASGFGTGQLPKSKEQMYYVEEDDLYAIPTAEVPVTNLYRDEIIKESELTKKMCAYSACFRREAGSYGKDTRGFLRVHQFNKVELVKITRPEESYQELENLRKDAEEIVKSLGLKYRVLELCDADLSFAAAKCYDIEVWAPGERKWLEVSSISNFEDFQARRINIRYRPDNPGKPLYVHTLNGSGLATARVLVALLETYQNHDGSLAIPDVLKPYMGGLDIIS